MYEIIDCTNNTYYVCELVKRYRMAFKSNNVDYRIMVVYDSGDGGYLY